MYGFSTVDGFLDVNQGVEEMIKYLANEPSVGLFFVQKHAQNAMPNVLNLKDKVVEKAHEMVLHTEDLEDSICAVRSMAECGLPIVDEMIKDINKALHVMSTSRPCKGLLWGSTWGLQTQGSSLQESTSYGDFTVPAHQEGGNSRSYLSAVFNSVKQKATNLRWSQNDLTPERSRPTSSSSSPWSAAPLGITAATDLETQIDELPLSSQIIDAQVEEGEGDITTGITPTRDMVLMFDNFEKFKSEQEAKLEEWLEEVEKHDRNAKTIV